jgi:hypothetical protein
MTAMRAKKAAPVVVVGGNKAHIKGFLDAYPAKQDIELMGTPLCLLRRLAESPPRLAVFLPGYAKESLEAAAEKGACCMVFVEHKFGDEYPKLQHVYWHYAAPDLIHLSFPFCTMTTFAKEVRSLVTFA